MNTYNHPKGSICVERSVNGQMIWLRIDPAWHYKEWAGCFTVL